MAAIPPDGELALHPDFPISACARKEPAGAALADPMRMEITASHLLRIRARSCFRPALLDDAQPGVQCGVGRPQSRKLTLLLMDRIDS
jgi:hypothetical protein